MGSDDSRTWLPAGPPASFLPLPGSQGKRKGLLPPLLTCYFLQLHSQGGRLGADVCLFCSCWPGHWTPFPTGWLCHPCFWIEPLPFPDHSLPFSVCDQRSWNRMISFVFIERTLVEMVITDPILEVHRQIKEILHPSSILLLGSFASLPLTLRKKPSHFPHASNFLHCLTPYLPNSFINSVSASMSLCCHDLYDLLSRRSRTMLPSSHLLVLLLVNVNLASPPHPQ